MDIAVTSHVHISAAGGNGCLLSVHAVGVLFTEQIMACVRRLGLLCADERVRGAIVKGSSNREGLSLQLPVIRGSIQTMDQRGLASFIQCSYCMHSGSFLYEHSRLDAFVLIKAWMDGLMGGRTDVSIYSWMAV